MWSRSGQKVGDGDADLRHGGGVVGCAGDHHQMVVEQRLEHSALVCGRNRVVLAVDKTDGHVQVG